MPLLSDAARESGLKIVKYITALQQSGFENFRPTFLIEQEIKRLAKRFEDPCPPSSWTLYRKNRTLKENNGDWISVFPNFAARGGSGHIRADAEVKEILSDVVERVRANKEAVSYKKVWGEVRGELISRKGEVAGEKAAPGLSVVTRCIKREIGVYDLYVRRHGKRAADKQFRNWHPRDRAVSPLEVVEFDDKDTRVFCIDERNGLPNGRAYLTSGIDQFSTVPLGFSISDRPRSTWSAINAFVNAVLPNNVQASEWSNVSSESLYFGKVGIAVFDNALYNHAKQLETTVLEVSNSIMAWAQPYTPTEKSIVEDFNGRVAIDFLPTLPGFAGEKHARDKLSEGLLAANLSILEFKRRFLKWCYDSYCHTPRAGGQTPAQRWAIGLEGRALRAPGDIHRIMLATTLSKRLKLRPEGVLLRGLVFGSPFVQQIRKRYGHNFEADIRFHPETTDYVLVKDPISGAWAKVESSQPEYTLNLTWAQHKLILKMAYESGIKNPSVPQLLIQRNSLAQLVEQLRFSPKLRDRKLANRISGSQTASYSLSEVVVSQTVTELEYQVGEVEQVVIESGEEGWELPEP